MAIDDFLQTYQQSMLNKKIVNPLTSTGKSMASPRLGITPQKRGIAQTPTFGASVPDWLQGRKTNALNEYMAGKSEITTDLATQYADKASGQVPTDKFGIVQDKTTDFNDFFNSQLGAIGGIGKNALATEEAKSEWQSLQSLKEQNAGYTVNYTPGASGGNKGAQAVSLAMQVAKNNVPYAWGGNSLTGGVDCSGLVQQLYKKMGINIPRTTYEQAKVGKQVSLGGLLPGDLVFYNTGSSDPNGIGSLSHVAIYIGNGQIIEAARKGTNVRIANINSAGKPAKAVRPW